MGLKNNGNNDDRRLNMTAILSSVLVVAVIIGIIFLMGNNKNSKDKDFAYTQLINSINSDTVEKVELTEGSDVATVKLVNDDKEKEVLIPSVDSFIELVQEKVNSRE